MSVKHYVVEWRRPHGNRMEIERAMYEADSMAEVVRGAKRIAKANGWKYVGAVRVDSPHPKEHP